VSDDPGTSDNSADPPRGLAVARQALAAARAEARRRGFVPGRAPAPDTRTGDEADRARSRWRRPVTEERSGAHPDDRDPQLLGPTLDRLVADRGWQADAAVGGVMGRWAEIVGPDVAAHAEPVSWQDGELVVQADSTAWATQIRLLAPALLARLAGELGSGAVTSVVVRGPSAPSWKRGLRSVRGRGPRDTYG
jgi:predicted nucleic acid-binding Zn ribbon protein